MLSVARFYFAQCVFMTTIHYKAYNRLQNRERILRIFSLIIASLTMLIIVLQTIGAIEGIQKLLDILSYCGLVLTGVSILFFVFTKENLSEIKVQHKNIAEEYKAIRDQFMLLIGKLTQNKDAENDNELDSMIQRYSEIGKYAPSTTGNDYEFAQKSLGIGNSNDEGFSWSNEEIDRFLPEELKNQ